MHTQKLTLDLPDELIREIEHYKEITHESSYSKAVVDLLKYALTLPPYFRNYDWEKAEAEADDAISRGKVKSFDSAEELIADPFKEDYAFI